MENIDALRGNTLRTLNLGCPKYCTGYLCVDRKPLDSRVLKSDVMQFLTEYPQVNPRRFLFIRTKNLLEHLPNVGRFLTLCLDNLEPYGMIHIITDNAEFLPFYFPLWIPHTGIGAHSRNEYAINHCDSVHYSIFTKMHLENLLSYAGFSNIHVERILLGARLKATGTK